MDGTVQVEGNGRGGSVWVCSRVERSELEMVEKKRERGRKRVNMSVKSEVVEPGL